MQQCMLFHSLYSPESGVYFEQSLFTIKGGRDVSAFERAWERVIDRHSILRTAFLWEDLEKPVQAVYRQVDLPLTKLDWRDLPANERALQLQSTIKADRDRGFVLSTAPLVRLMLIRFTEDEYKFLFSRHHLLLDRWSRALLLKDFFAVYDAFSAAREPELEVSKPYGDYINWLAQQDVSAAEEFWKRELAGFSEPTPFAVDRKKDGAGHEEKYADQRIQLSAELTEQLQAFARQQRLTLNTIAQGAWSLLLARYNRTDDVVFGVTVAGRPATLPGVEAMVGLFINTLPLRVRLPGDAAVVEWLQSLQEQQAALQQYEYSSLLDIQ